MSLAILAKFSTFCRRFLGSDPGPQGNSAFRGVAAPPELEAQVEVGEIALAQQVAFMRPEIPIETPDDQFPVLRLPGFFFPAVYHPARQIFTVEEGRPAR